MISKKFKWLRGWILILRGRISPPTGRKVQQRVGNTDFTSLFLLSLSQIHAQCFNSFAQIALLSTLTRKMVSKL